MSHCSSHFCWWPWVNLAFTQTWPYWCLVSFLDDWPLHYTVSKPLSPSTGGTIIVRLQTTGKMYFRYRHKYFRFRHRDGGRISRRKPPVFHNWLVATPRLVLELNSPIRCVTWPPTGPREAEGRLQPRPRGPPSSPDPHCPSFFCC